MRIRLRTEWVEWRKEDDDTHRLRGERDFPASIKKTGDDYVACVYSHARYRASTGDWFYGAPPGTVDNLSSLDEAKEACLRILVEYGLLDPLDLLMDMYATK